MKKLLILTRFPPEYEPQKLAKAAKKRRIEPEIVNYQDVLVEPGKVVLPHSLKLEDFDFIIPRSAAHHSKKSRLKEKIAIIKALSKEVRCLNKETYLRYPKLGKIKQVTILNQYQLPTIPTMRKPILHRLQGDDSRCSSRHKSGVAQPRRKPTDKEVSFPAILKAEFGSHSRRVIRVENQKQARKVMKSYAGKWIYQPLIKSPVYWRVIVLGGKSLGVMERETSKRFLRSGEGERPDVSREEIEDLAVKTTQALKAEFTGVDLLADKNKLMIIEVNRSPQFQIFEKLTKVKVNVAEKLINYLTIASRQCRTTLTFVQLA